MQYVADLHIHSRFSRATSRQLDLEHLWIWAQLKGVQVVGTGDFTHPGWFSELEQKLVPAGEEGLYRLQPELERALQDQVPPACRGPVRFLLSVEISNIYKCGERTRKVHNLICSPDLTAASALNQALAAIGNIKSDGRPILGLDSRDLLERVLESSDRALLIPAHIWTPWFSALGSKSGFDSIEECYRDLSPHIFAVETGLSSDPPMNWRLSSLDKYALVSNSDAHSPSKLAREANLFDCELSYEGLFDALRRRGPGFIGTVEFFPEEGKYHLDGHRKCESRLTPEQTREQGGRCPVCGKPVTKGVMYRIEELADRPLGSAPAEGAAPFVSLVGLAEILSEVHGVGPASKKVGRNFDQLLARLGPELSILREVPGEDLASAGGPVLAEAVGRMRRGEVQIAGGYDGEFGKVKLLSAQESEELSGQTTLFAPAAPPIFQSSTVPPFTPLPMPPLTPPTPSPSTQAEIPQVELLVPENLDPLEGLSASQREAVLHGGPLVIVAGPGTGKTRTLTCRIAYWVSQGFPAEEVLAVTFTRKAAGELRARLDVLLGSARASAIRVCTFHALALSILNEHRQEQGQPSLRIIDPEERLELLTELLDRPGKRRLQRAEKDLTQALLRGGSCELLVSYQALLSQEQAADLDGLVGDATALLQREPETLGRWRDRCRLACVDEYQDVNQSQYELIRQLCPVESNLCVIGDPDQAIYSFRGADPRYFLRFHQDYPGAGSATLDRSYRSTRPLLEAAQGVIRNNSRRMDISTWSDRPGQPRLTICTAATVAAEAEYVVHTIERSLGGITHFSMDSGRSDGSGTELLEQELSFSDFAVLFRQGNQAEALREAFDRSGMPYSCTAGQPPLQIMTPVLELLQQALRLEHPGSPLIEQVRGWAPRKALSWLVEQLLPSEQHAPARQHAEELAALIYQPRSELNSWAPKVLALAAASTEADGLTDREAISLLTLHASKGLEFSVVFIVGCEEGLLPHLLPGEDPLERVPEERRLMYVGMTRAKQVLVLMRARKRLRRGQVQPSRPSRFLEEISAERVLQAQPDPLSPRRRKEQLSLF